MDVDTFLGVWFCGFALGIGVTMSVIAFRNRQADHERRRTKCCEHNPCPQRPTTRLANYARQPWRCPQCGGWWITKHQTSWATMEEGGYWEWAKVSQSAGDAWIEDLK